jgi:micrococcal nuclease
MVNFKGFYSHRITFLFSTLILLVSVLLPVCSHSSIRTIEGTVMSVSDGDTFKLETPEGTKVKVRLYGIDAPEKKQPFGDASFDALKSKILGQKVTVDVVTTDRYKRTVGIVSLNGRCINTEMIREGWAWAYTEYLKRPYASEYINAEKEARDKGLGLWKQRNPQPPWEYRKIVGKTIFDKRTT